MILRPAAWLICLAAVLLVTACGSGDDTADEPPASRPAVSARVDEPGSGGSEGGAGVCDDRQMPAGRAYAVAEIPADDPDGGLVLLDVAGEGGVQVAILPSGAPVIATGDPAACAVLPDGVWWHVRSADGVRGWVDSGSLSPRG